MDRLWKRQQAVKRASFSRCKTYRYSLTRQWGVGSTLLVVGLNPSIADAQIDDPTVRRCIGFAKSWGFDRLVMANLFAYRSTDPNLLTEVEDPVGPMNDRSLRKMVDSADLLLVAWGTRGDMLNRDEQVLTWLPRPHCLGTTRTGFPRHPLYVRGDVRPAPYI
jgi:hypothetical protein